MELNTVYGNLSELKKTETERFSIVQSMDIESFADADTIKNKDEILLEVDTDEMIKKCEELIKNIKAYLNDSGILYDQVSLYSQTGVVCNETYLQKAKEICSHKYEIDIEESTQEEKEYFKSLLSNVLYDVVPLTFYVDLSLTRNDDDPIAFHLDQADFKKFRGEFKISGLVNYSLFVSKMKDLGFNIFLTSTGEADTFENYIETIKEGNDDSFSIVSSVELEPEKAPRYKNLNYFFTMINKKWTDK